MRYTDTINETYEFRADADGVRLDQFLVKKSETFSRSFLKKLIDDKLVTINGEPCKASRKLKNGDEIVLNIPELVELSAEPEDIKLEVLYEDSDIIVINKQPGFVVHPSAGHENGTLVNALLFHCNDLSGIGGELRPGIVHRLDRDTTGCIVCAKNDHAHQNLVEQFSARSTEKHYLAITHSTPHKPSGKVEGNIGRSSNDRKKMALMDNGGRYSLTFYEVRSANKNYSLIECDIKTGRTHQIRVHLKSLGCPIICDADYGRESCLSAGELAGKKAGGECVINRQALHAFTLSVNHPRTEQRMSFKAPPPQDFIKALSAAGLDNLPL